MRSEPGVYALVLRLDRRRTIAYTRSGGSHMFPRGWYVYVGSACGGGLARRIGRHATRKADGRKKMHWHVDYLREHAELVEAWYASTGNNAHEHAFARCVRAMSGASVPVPGFGNRDCRAGCPAHLFRFQRRPLTAAFRAQVARLGPDGMTILASLPEDAARRFERSGTPLFREYLLGRRFLEARRSRVAEPGEDGRRWRSLAHGRPARRLAEETAAASGVDAATMLRAAHLAEAVETITVNCGEVALNVLFDSELPQRRSAIETLARTADTRQRYRFEGVRAGRFRLVGPLPTTPTTTRSPSRM